MARRIRKIGIAIAAIIALSPLFTVGAWAAYWTYYYTVTEPKEQEQHRQHVLHQANHNQILADCQPMLASPQNYLPPGGSTYATTLPHYLSTLQPTAVHIDTSGVMVMFNREWGLWVPAPGTVNPASTIPGFNGQQLVPGLWYYDVGP